MTHYSYSTQGTCSKKIDFDIENNKVYNLSFLGGCPGNTLGLTKLVEGLSIEEVITKLEGVKCGFRTTSCPDQLAKALKKALKND